jgi:CPA2 family monovalent cation:H+ antiporter-2
MPHDSPLISTIVAGLVLAFILGAIVSRFRMPPLVGYLIAGVVVGPFTPGFVANAEIATELSEIGVILLMFGVGLHFSLKDLMSVQALAVPGALIRIAGGTLMGVGLAALLGWSIGAGLLFGLALSVASTVVLLKALQDRHWIDSDRGRIAVGWVIVEDVAMVLALVLIPAIASIWGVTEATVNDPFINFVERMLGTDIGIAGVFAVTILKLAAFVGFMFVVGRRLIPMVLHYTAHTGSRELFRLAVLSIALGVAAGAAYLFGVSLALGAFFAGMILSESELSHRAAEESLPLRDAFAVLFFVSVGMLFNPSILITNPLPVLGTVFIILVGKSVIAFAIIVAFRRPIGTALTVAASLAQIGEFSFILATLGLDLGILPPEAQDLILAGAILSILLNPALIWAADRMRPMVEARFGKPEAEPAIAGRVEPSLAEGAVVHVEPAEVEEEVVHPTALTGHTVLIGYGRVGSVVAAGLKEAKKPFVVVEDAEGRINAARAAGLEVIVGNAAASKPLKLANIEGATTVIVAIPNAFEAGQAIDQCRKANPNVLIITRAHSDEEEHYLHQLGANVAIMGEREIGMAMLGLVNPDNIAAAASSPHDAIEAAIIPKGGKTFRTLPREPERKLTDIDEEELARAIGAPAIEPKPVEPPVPDLPAVVDPAAPPAVVPEDPVTLAPRPGPSEAMSIDETDAIDVLPAEPPPPPVVAPDEPAMPQAEPEKPSAAVLPFKKSRKPATKPATTFVEPEKPEPPKDGADAPSDDDKVS